MEILFKAKREDTGEWVEGLLIKDSNGACYVTVYDFVPMMPGHERRTTLPLGCKHKDKWVLSVDIPVFEVDPETVCLYTGIQDKKENKIFEFDKVYDPHENRIFIVAWDKELARFVLRDKDGRMNADVERLFYCEVIGNIYDKGE